MDRPTGAHAVAIASTMIGAPYIWGVLVPKGDADYDGSKGFDCAELASWVYGVLVGQPPGMGRYFGCNRAEDAYSGFWFDDAQRYGTCVSPEEAARIPGAVLVRRKRPGKAGHVAISTGHGMTIEAHSRQHGVCSREIAGRVWDLGCLVPGVEYRPAKGVGGE